MDSPLPPIGSPPRLALAPPASLLALVLALYLPFLHAPYVFDDFGYIAENPAVANPLVLLDSQRLEQPDVAGNVRLHGRTRALGIASFWLTRTLGGETPAAHRVLSIAVHAGNACLLYCLILLAFRTPRLRGSALAPRAPAVAWTAAALFALHPLATEAVIYPSQRFTSLCALFYLGALAAYAASRQRQGSRSGGALFALSLLLALLAAFTKENAATLPLALALYEGLFHEGPRRTRAARLVPFALVALLVPLVLVVNTSLPLREAVRKAGTTNIVMTRTRYAATELGVFLTYLRLAALPVGQALDYDYPEAETPLEPRALAGLAALLAVLAGAAYALARSTPGLRGGDPALRLAAFGLAWVPVAIAVESGPGPLTDVIAEHRFYLPLAGAACAASALGALALRTRPRTALAVATTVFLAFSALTLARGAVWMSAEALWRDTARKSPGKQRPLAALAEEQMRKALALVPSSAPAREHLGHALFMQGRYAEAAREYRAALAANPLSRTAHFALAETLTALGDHEAAAGHYRSADTPR